VQTWTFLREFVRKPANLGSIVPSSPVLADKVVEAADIPRGGRVVELGAGTGPITEALLRRHPHLDLLALEPTPSLAASLRRRFPELDLREERADRHLRALVAQSGPGEVDRVVSGLPWTLWPRELQVEVLRGVVDVLAEDGRFLTYTYLVSQARPAGRAFRALLAEAFETVWHTEVVWRNVPPAVVLVADRPRRSWLRTMDAADG